MPTPHSALQHIRPGPVYTLGTPWEGLRGNKCVTKEITVHSGEREGRSKGVLIKGKKKEGRSDEETAQSHATSTHLVLHLTPRDFPTALISIRLLVPCVSTSLRPLCPVRGRSRSSAAPCHNCNASASPLLLLSKGGCLLLGSYLYPVGEGVFIELEVLRDKLSEGCYYCPPFL